jgi:predicted nucleic acid-binding protein
MAWRSAYLDANAVIGAVERDDELQFNTLVDLAGIAEFHTSEITLHEVLVLPLRRGDRRLVEAFSAWFDAASMLTVVPVSRSVLVRAAELRAQSSMKMPDAIHVASADLSSCDVIVSHDRRLHLPPPLERLDPSPRALHEWLLRK